MMDIYDKEGKLITLDEYTALYTPEYKIIKQELAVNYFISTVWLGINHAFRSAKPIIFETMVFDSYDEIYCKRYSTLEEAKAGHDSVVEDLKAGTLDVR